MEIREKISQVLVNFVDMVRSCVVVSGASEVEEVINIILFSPYGSNQNRKLCIIGDYVFSSTNGDRMHSYLLMINLNEKNKPGNRIF